MSEAETSSYPLFDPEEMVSFGFDPNSDTDREEWLRTTPPYGTPAVVDYSADPFEFGASSSSDQAETAEQ